MIAKIGGNAGLVWKALNDSKSALTVKELKKATKLTTEKEVFLAIGWLAKEEKLEFTGEVKDFRVKLK